MEAMASGLPVLCSDIRGNVDLIENGKGGYTYNKFDSDGFAQGIDKLANDEQLRSNMVKHNRKKLEKFSIENVRAEYLRILNNLVTDFSTK